MASPARLLAVILLLAGAATLHAACSVNVETRDGFPTIHYSLQRLSDYRLSTIHGFLDLQVASPAGSNAGDTLVALPSQAIVEVTTNALGSRVVYELIRHGAPDRREVAIPATLLRPEQVRLLVSQSLTSETPPGRQHSINVTP